MMAVWVKHHSMEQWVTTTDEFSAGGRYASLTEVAACLVSSNLVVSTP
jgi:hypothetical protein